MAPSNNRTHCLFVAPILGIGGAEKVLTTLLKHIDAEKFKISLIILCNGHSNYLDELPPSISIYYLNQKRVRDSFFKLYFLIIKLRPNVIFSSLSYLNLMMVFISIIYPWKARFICRESTFLSAAVKTYNHIKLWSFFYKLFYKKIDFIVCQSKIMMDDLHANFNIPLNKMRVINNPIDISLIQTMSNEHISFQISREKFNIVSISRLSHEKGIDILIEAISLLPELPICLKIIGSGELELTLKQYLKSLAIGHRVEFLGFLKNPYPILKASDLFVLSSRIEGFPNVILEALVCDIPVVATPSEGGVRESLSMVSGITFCDEISSISLANSIRNAFYNPTKIKKDLSQYNLQDVIYQYESILK